MSKDLTIQVNYKGETVDMMIFADSIEHDRSQGSDVSWVGQIDEDGEPVNVIEISEYPEGAFTLIESSDDLVTPPNQIISALKDFLHSENERH